MCDQCNDELDALLESLHDHHDTVDERLDALVELHVRLREALTQAREDANLLYEGEDEEDEDTEEGEDE
jgi:hypothetical protein